MKQVIVVNSSLNMGEGKMAAQVAHASLGSYERAREKSRSLVERWMPEKQKKVVLKGEDAEHLEEMRREAELRELPCYLVRDAGLTQLETGTTTALGIGPAEDEEVDRVTGRLPLM